MALAALLALHSIWTPAPVQPAHAQHAAPAEQLDLAETVTAYRAARQWIDQFELPPMDSPDAAVPISGAAGVYVALRANGRVVGAGIDVEGGDRAMRRAVGRALSELLGDEAVRTVPDDLRHTVGRALLLEIEIAAPLQPLIAVNESQVARHYEPGLDGLAMRRGSELALVFPAMLRRTGNTHNIGAAIARLASTLRLKAAPLAELNSRHNISLYRFRALHLVQSDPAGSPFTTHRGLRLVSADDVTAESVREFADAAAAHLISRLWPGGEPLGLLGNYDPLRDQYQPLTASPRDQALAAYALGLYAAWMPERETAPPADAAAAEILLELALVEPTEAPPFDDPATCALLLAAASRQTVTDRDTAALIDRALDTLSPIIHSHGEELRAALREFDPTTRGMIALGVQQSDVDPAAASRVLDACLDVTDERSLVATMPWAYVALLSTSVADSDSTRIDDAELRDLRLALWSQQVKQPGAPSAGAPHNTDWLDLIGGFALSAEPAASRNRPTAQSARPAALLALMFSDDRLTTDATRDIARQNQRLAMRYLMQLQITDADAWAFRNPGRALGGIRDRTWSADLPSATTAMALIAAVLTDHALTRDDVRNLEPDSELFRPNVRQPAECHRKRP